VIKTFKPGNTKEALTTRQLPDTPGYEKVNFFKMNKASKGRVKVNPKTLNSGDFLQSDVGGDCGDQYLLDFEELKKAMGGATGAADNQEAIKKLLQTNFNKS